VDLAAQHVTHLLSLITYWPLLYIIGVRVMRFADSEVLEDVDGVVTQIKTELQKPFERPKIEAAR